MPIPGSWRYHLLLNSAPELSITHQRQENLFKNSELAEIEVCAIKTVSPCRTRTLGVNSTQGAEPVLTQDRIISV